MDTLSSVLDQTEKSGAHRLLVTSVLERDGLVKEASAKFAEISEGAELADPWNKLWPIGNSQEIIESAVSIELQRTKMADARYWRVVGAVNKAAALHQCLPAVRAARERVAVESRTEKTAGVVNYALPEAGAFPINTSGNVNASITEFCENRAKLPHPWRQKVATAIIEASRKYPDGDVRATREQWDTLEKSAGTGFGLPHPVARQLVRRAEFIVRRNPRVAYGLYKMAIALAEMDTPAPADLMETMKHATRVMDEVDDRYDLRHRYGKELEFPEDVAFTTTPVKMATAREVLLQVGGKIYQKTEIAGIKAAAFNVLGKEFVDSIRDANENIDPDKFEAAVKSAVESKLASPSVFDRVMRGFGVRSVNPSEDTQAKVVDGSEINNWKRVAESFGTDLEKDMGDGFNIRFPDPADMGLGSDQRPVI